MKHHILLFLFLITATLSKGQVSFNYKKAIAGDPSLSASVSTLNRTTGEVVFVGGDSRGPSTPGLTFTWIWGDGTSSNGFFPQTKKYADVTKNYTAKVIANYSATEKDTVDVLVLFTKPTITPVSIDNDLQVFIPNQPISFSSHYYTIPTKPTYYTNDTFFSGNVSRADLAYTLSVFSTIEVDMANNDVYRYNGKLQHIMLRDSSFGGAYSLWFTDPMSLAVGDAVLKNIDFSSLAHELGHNITLNSPANYIFGGKIDGNANAIFSESMAQIFQHTVGYIVLNNYAKYGFDPEFTGLMKQWFLADFGTTRRFYEQYISGGKAFASWNDPATPTDEALFTFGTIAYKFCDYAEQQNKGYLTPAKRLMQFLQRFNADWQRRYDQANNNPAADAFRATMMVAALSHAFQKDLRADFRALNFPISDSDWAFLNPALLDATPTSINLPATASNTTSFSVTSTASTWAVSSSQPWLTVSAGSGSGNQSITLSATSNLSVAPRTATITVSANGFVDRTLSVTQAGTAPSLTTSIQSLTLPAEVTTSSSVTLTSNTSWSISSSQPWLTITPGLGSGNQIISVAATANTSVSSRTALITILANGIPNQAITVTQAGATATLATSVQSLTTEATGTSNSVNITSNTSWSVSSSQTWVTVSPGSASGNAALTVTTATNTGVDSRTALVTVSANGASSQTITVLQRGIIVTAIINPLEESLRVYPNPASNTVYIDGLPVHATVSLYDLRGRLLHQSVSRSLSYPLSVEKLSAGTYYLQVTSDEKTAIRRLLKIP